MAPGTEYNIPHDRHYDSGNHMWAKAESEDKVRVGIDELGLASLGDLAYLTLQATGVSVRRGDSLGTIEAAKMTGDIIAPISGKLVARNEQAQRDPSIVNRDPYGEGWLVDIQPQVWDEELLELVSGEAIPEWFEAEIARYRSEGWID